MSVRRIARFFRWGAARRASCEGANQAVFWDVYCRTRQGPRGENGLWSLRVFGHDESQAPRLDESPIARHTTEGVPIAFRYLRKEQRAASRSRGSKLEVRPRGLVSSSLLAGFGAGWRCLGGDMGRQRS